MSKQTIGNIVGIRSDPRQFGPSNLLLNDRCFLGVEIELENMREFSMDYFESDLWSSVDDGSLRNYGIEFVMGYQYKSKSYHPLCGGDVINALEDFKNAIQRWSDDTEYKPKISDRTGFHVHLDVRELDIFELRTLVFLGIVFEKLLFKFAGEGRETNNNCKPVFSTDQIKEELAKLFSGDKPEVSLKAVGNMDKYSACNLLSITARGSVEYRIHKGTWDTDEILTWINIILALKHAAVSGNFSLNTLPEQMSALGMTQFLKDVFKEKADLLLPYSTEADILAGVRVAQEIMQYQTLADDSVRYHRSSLWKKAKGPTLLERFAEVNERQVYQDEPKFNPEF